MEIVNKKFNGTPIGNLLNTIQAKYPSYTDIHLTVNKPPVVRHNGILMLVGNEPLTDMNMMVYVQFLLTPEQQAVLEAQKSVDFSFSAEAGRFRGNIYIQRGSYSIALRKLSDKIPTIEDLNLPPIVYNFCAKKRGLVLVTGPTGSGKSTTLAAMIQYIVNEEPVKVITIEDPIEYIFDHGLGIVDQREVGSDVKSFADALKYALREDPDVVMVGEMRDMDSIATTLTLAETGHLVLATLHTKSAAETVDRIVDSFPDIQQQQVRLQLSMVLEGIISQRLLPHASGEGLVLAYEVAVGTPAIRNAIRSAKTQQIPNMLVTGKEEGMVTMDQVIAELCKMGHITMDTAIEYAVNPSDVTQRVKK